MDWRATLHSTTRVTAELRDLVESGVNIWDFEYDGFYEGDAKAAFEKKVIDHYYFRQIGQETVGRFLHYFRTRIREIMPYYKQVYKSIQIMDGIDDPFGNIDITETFEQTSESSSESSSTSRGNGSNNSTHKYSATPQGSISTIDEYLTEATVDNSSNTSEGSGEGSSSAEGVIRHTLTKRGNQGVNTYAHDMVEFRQTFLNIDKMIIDDLDDLFLGVY